ncbi:hypothetical protein [Pseudomonas phage 98PfluR60PP]|uniref:Uncharacterized protein n=1 Tax=Pseudomonas phage 98PfluR60PP TaxID=2163965 RepID=A0A2S1PG16_9CAUD|nr:hypothetical protein PP760_gp80 [Pseudomonas phage 98PfluR60PP]AWH15512.1 hypothetical protein [Pseudomonas phage 98PfluR60PP]
MNITPNEAVGLLAVISVLLILFLLGISNRRKHVRTYPMTVSFFCNWSGEQFITPVRNLQHAQCYINKVNLSTVGYVCIYKDGVATHKLNVDGVWVVSP